LISPPLEGSGEVFNEQKYKDLLEGLEVTEVFKSELSKNDDNENFRIDSDFFKKEFIIDEKNIKTNKWDYLGNLSKSIINFGAYSLCNQIDFLEEGVPYLNVADIKEDVINWENAKKISKDLSVGLLHKSLAKHEQVLLTIAGTIGNAAVAYKLPMHTNSNQAIANITTKEELNPFYLSVYLNSKYGKSQTRKLTISSVQPNLLLTQVKRIKVPILPIDFQQEIEKSVKVAHSKREQSQTLYCQAEELLLETIGLEPGFLQDYKDCQDKENLVNLENLNKILVQTKTQTKTQTNYNIKTFKESFLTTGRLDAEYYQPKYEEMIKHIGKFETEIVKNIVKIKKSIEPGSDAYQNEGIPFIRVANVSKFGITDTDIYLDKKKYGNLGLQPQKDTILLSKDGSVGIAYKIEQNLDVITSGALLHLTVTNKDFLPDYLTLVLNSEVVKMQAERDAGGSIIQHWKPSEIEQVIIPKLSMEIQQQISALIQESFALRKESKRLLVEAKAMVEREIEKKIEILC